VHIEVRDATAGDASAVADLFHNTLLNVNVGDYSVAQVEAWAGPVPETWDRRITEDSSTRRMFVATKNYVVVGFAVTSSETSLWRREASDPSLPNPASDTWRYIERFAERVNLR
jgi:hypothetical protein